MVTTWAAFTEAMNLLGQAGGIRGQSALWRHVTTERLLLADLSATALQRAAALMTKYADLPTF